MFEPAFEMQLDSFYQNESRALSSANRKLVDQPSIDSRR
jgi:hypothetical protein